MKFIIILTSLCLASTSFARDPNVLPRSYEYGGGYTVGGSKWSGGDTFLAIALPVAVLMLISLPQIFDGNRSKPLGTRVANGISSMCYYRPKVSFPIIPLWIASQGQRWGINTTPLRYKFPTRRLCENI